MAYLETNFTSEFSTFIKKHREEYNLDVSALFEHKVKKAGSRLNFKSDFRPHQINYLVKAQNGCVYWKMSDMDVRMKPADAFQVCYVPSYAVICWYKPRTYKNVYFISGVVLQSLIDEGKKSITEEEASGLSHLTLDFMEVL